MDSDPSRCSLTAKGREGSRTRLPTEGTEVPGRILSRITRMGTDATRTRLRPGTRNPERETRNFDIWAHETNDHRGMKKKLLTANDAKRREDRIRDH
jgi:hypothetical protein